MDRARATGSIQDPMALCESGYLKCRCGTLRATDFERATIIKRIIFWLIPLIGVGSAIEFAALVSGHADVAAKRRNALVTPMSTPDLGIARYVRPIDLSQQLRLNRNRKQTRLVRSLRRLRSDETALGGPYNGSLRIDETAD